MWRNRLQSFTLIELLISIAILMILIVASIPLLISDKEKAFKDNVQRMTTFVEKAKNFSLNPDSDNKDAVVYRINRTGGNFTITAHKSDSDPGTPVADEVQEITGAGYSFCGDNLVDFKVGSGVSTVLKRIGIRKNSFQAGIEITPEGQIKTLSTSPC